MSHSMNIAVDRLKLIIKYLITCLLLTGLLSSNFAKAVHLDVEVWGEGNALFAGYCRTPGVVGCDLGELAQQLQLPSGFIPREQSTGKLIFLADFRDFTGGDFRTNNPGFQSIQNALLPNELISYRALGNLRYWHPSLSAWGAAPTDTQVNLFGGLEASPDFIKNFTQCAGQLLCVVNIDLGNGSSTIFTANGISGNPELVVDITKSNGVLHTHLNFFLQYTNGQAGGAIGAYLVELQLISNARFFPSEPFYILINAGLNKSEIAAALLALTGNSPNINPNPPQPPIPPLSIPGDIDLDGDVDRIDVALILLAAQENEQINPTNTRLDVDKNGIINREDALLAKRLCTLRLCNLPINAPATSLNMVAIYDEVTKKLNLNDIQVGNEHYRAELQYQGEDIFALRSVQLDKQRYATPIKYFSDTKIVEIPSVYVNGKQFSAILHQQDGAIFKLKALNEIK